MTDLLLLSTLLSFLFHLLSSALRVEYSLNESRFHVSVISLLDGR